MSGDVEPYETKVSRRNRITLPVAAFAAASLKAGDLVQVEVLGDGKLKLVRYRDPRLDLLEEIAGSAPGLSEEANFEELRNEWEQ